MTDKEEPSIEEQARLAEMIAVTEDNDPYGTHEMGFMSVQGKAVWFLQHGVPQPLCAG